MELMSSFQHTFCYTSIKKSKKKKNDVELAFIVIIFSCHVLLGELLHGRRAQETMTKKII